MNYRDVEVMNQAFGGLADSMLRNRMLQEQQTQHAQDMALRQQEVSRLAANDALAQKLKREEMDWEKDPSNPRNKEQNSLADYHKKQMDQLGIKKFTSTWTSGGKKIDFEGTQDELKQTVQDNPPDTDGEMSIQFTTKDGVTVHQKGTKKALDAMVQGYQGQIQQPGAQLQQWNDDKGNTYYGLVNPKTGATHVFKPTDQGFEETKQKVDPLTGKALPPETTVRRPLGSAKASAAAAAKTLTDKKGVKWRYLGSMADPSQDKDPSHWQKVLADGRQADSRQ